MRKILIPLLLSLFITAAVAGDIFLYHIGKVQIAFVRVDGLVVNKDCADKKCLAYKKGMQFKNAEVPSELLEGGKNPSSVRCKALMGGRVLIGRDLKDNDQSFCNFSDNSFLR